VFATDDGFVVRHLWDPVGMEWLVASIVLSVVLTVVLNVVVRAVPGAGDAIGRKAHELTARDRHAGDDRRVRVWFPWKAMLLGSIALTVLLNLVLALS
jgi:hypothetical protein